MNSDCIANEILREAAEKTRPRDSRPCDAPSCETREGRPGTRCPHDRALPAKAPKPKTESEKRDWSKASDAEVDRALKRIQAGHSP